MASCLNCGGEGTRGFCPDCGQRHVPADALDLRHVWLDYVEETVRELRPLRTLWGLLRRPGQLAVDYVEGRRRGQANPLLFFLFVIGIVVTLQEYYDPNSHNDWMSQRLQTPAVDLQVTSAWWFRLTQVVMAYLLPSVRVAYFAGVLWLLAERDLLKGVVLALHVQIVKYLLLVVFWAPSLLLPAPGQLAFAVASPVLVSLPATVYLLLAVRNAYALSWPRAVGVLGVLVVLPTVLINLAAVVAGIGVALLILAGWVPPL